MAPVARGVKGRRRFRDVLADDRDVANLPVTLSQFVVGEPDGARFMRDFGLLQGASVQRDGARLIAARVGQATVQSPQRREAARRNRVAEGIGRTAERARRVIQIVLQERRLGEHRAHGEFVFARQRRPKRRLQHLRGLEAAAALERSAGASEQRLQRGRRHVGNYRAELAARSRQGVLQVGRSSRTRSSPMVRCRSDRGTGCAHVRPSP